MANLRWTQDEYERYMVHHNNPAVPVADVERDSSHAAEAKVKTQEIHPRVCIRVHHRSRKAADATGRCHKWAVDGLVRGGILVDDSPKYVKEITETFEIGKDQTIITIESLNDQAAKGIAVKGSGDL